MSLGEGFFNNVRNCGGLFVWRGGGWGVGSGGCVSQFRSTATISSRLQSAFRLNYRQKLHDLSGKERTKRAIQGPAVAML